MKNTVILMIISALILICGCSSGHETNPVTPSVQDDVRSTLNAAASSLERSDLGTALNFFYDRTKNERILRRLKDSWPLLAKAIRDAGIEKIEPGLICLHLSIPRPDSPGEFIESKFYLVRSEENGKWLLSPVPIRLKKQDDRKAAWGTNTVHGSYLSRAIVEYYIRNYTTDYEFTGPNGFLKQNKFLYPVIGSHPGPVDTILGIYDVDIYENIPPDAIITRNAPTALIQLGSVDEDVFLGENDTSGNLVFNRDIIVDFATGVKFVTNNNFGGSDDTIFKGYAHFLTPYNQNYPQNSFIGFNDMGILGNQDSESAPADKWGLGMEKIGPVNIIDVVDMRENMNRKTWQYAIQQFRDSKSEPKFQLKVKEIADSFYAFGHVLHLLEDCGIPAHVRNDTHGIPAASYIPGLGYMSPDPLEDWSDSFNSGLINRSVQLYAELMVEHYPIVRYPDGFSEPLADYYFKNPELPQYPGYDALFKSLAYMTNRTFMSDDTIHVSTQSYADTSAWPEITGWEFDYGGRTVIYGHAGLPFYDETHPLAVSTTYFDIWALGFWTLHWRWPDLDEVISSQGDGSDLFTTEDSWDDDYFTDSNWGVRETQYDVQFKRTVRHGAALLHEFYLETHK